MREDSIVPLPAEAAETGTGNEARYILKSIRIENFKSYKGEFEISPFPVDVAGNPLVCVVGPNGSGKSNLMDAVAFCFNCADATKLRGDGSAASLISEGDAGRATVAVTLCAKTSIEDIVFQRSIATGGESRYSINGRKVTLEKYRETMTEAGLDTKGTFLVFQGDVEALALADPATLGKVIDRVSGSAALAKDFGNVKDAKAQLEGAYAALAARKKKLTTERKQVKNELAEITKIDQLVKRKQGAVNQYFLSKLWLVDQTEETTTDEPMTDLAAVKAELSKNQALMETAKAARAKADMRHSKLARKLITEETELVQSGAVVERLEMKVKTSEEKLERLNAALAVRREKAACVKAKLISLEKRMADSETELENALGVLDKLITGGVTDVDCQRDRDLVLPFLTSAGMTKDEASKTLSRVRNVELPLLTAELADELTKIDKEIEHERHAAKILSERRTELSDQLVKNEASERVVHGRMVELEQVIAGKTKELKKLKKELDNSKTAKLTTRFNKLEAEKKTLLDELSDIKESEAEHARERQLAETVSEMTVRFGDKRIFGRVVDLVKPSEERLAVAVQTAIGRFMDAVFVRDVSVAREAVAWLKLEKRGQITFIPVDDVAVSVKSVPGDCLAALDAIALTSRVTEEAKPFVQRGLEFVLGDVAICDSIQSARRVAYARHADGGLTFVTAAGEKISTNGTITIGGSSQKASRFALRAVTDITTKLEVIDKELSAVQTDLRAEAAAGEKLSAEIRAKEHDLANENSRLNQLKAEFKRLSDAVATIAKYVDDNREEAAAGETKMAEITNRKLEKQTAVRDLVVSSVRMLLGSVKDIEGSDQNLLLAIAGSVNDPTKSAKSQLEQSKARQKEIVAGLEAAFQALSGERKCLELELREASDTREIEAEAAGLSKAKCGTEKELAKASKENDARAATVAAARAELAEVKQIKSDQELKIKELGALLHSLREQELQQRSIADASRKRLEAIKQRKLSVLKEAVMANAYIPLKLSEEDLMLGPHEEVSRKILESVFVSLTAVVPYNSQASQDSLESLVDEVLDKIDFEALSEDFKRKAALSQRKERLSALTADLTRDFNNTLREVEGQLAQCGTVSRREGETVEAALVRIDAELKRVADSAENQKAQLEEATERLRRLTHERNSKFLNCFKFVARKVDELYKLLTSYDSGHISESSAIIAVDAVSTAAASLDLETPIPSDLASSELFSSGVIFSLMPPYKRYTSIELLSGGEKTVAAVALVFSLLAFSAPPFSMVDEIDAALDAGNLAVLARFMRRAVSQQLIAISLKENLYSKADCLIGVYKDSHTSGSGLVTVDLRPYPEEADEDEQVEPPAPQSVQKGFRGPQMTPGTTPAPLSSRREGRVLAGGA